MNKKLRLMCKELKLYQNIPYTELASLLEIKRNSFYNWLRGDYEFSLERCEQLYDVINILKTDQE